MPLPPPKGRQREVLYLPGSRNIVVLGTAGSGKTTMAILRAAYLANALTDPGRRGLLVTFNRTLVTYLWSLAPEKRRCLLANLDLITEMGRNHATNLANSELLMRDNHWR